MRLDALEILRALMHGVMAAEELATQADLLGAAAHDAGDVERTSAYRQVVRHHRIEAMELQGERCALSKRYVDTYHTAS